MLLIHEYHFLFRASAIHEYEGDINSPSFKRVKVNTEFGVKVKETDPDFPVSCIKIREEDANENFRAGLAKLAKLVKKDKLAHEALNELLSQMYIEGRKSGKVDLADEVLKLAKNAII